MTQVAANVQKAIESAQRMRETHVRWRDHLARHPTALAVTNLVGDAARHERLIEEYDNVLACLTAMKPDVPKPGTLPRLPQAIFNTEANDGQ